MRLPFYQVDAFTNAPFGGNPAAVVLLDQNCAAALDEKTRQSIAAEYNLSETAFLELPSNASEFQSCSNFILRWNTPIKEVKLCGHATLAAAAAVAHGEKNESEELRFQTKWSGELVVRRAPAATGFMLEMDLPLERMDAKTPEWAHDSSVLIEAMLGSHRSLLEEVCFSGRLKYLLLALKRGTTREQLEAITPDFAAALAAVTMDQIVVTIITAQGEPGTTHDVISRVFCPWSGIPEDPVTGSAHAVLGPYWAERLGKDSLTARQHSRRGGELKLSVDRAAGRVQLLGNAVILSKGELYL